MNLPDAYGRPRLFARSDELRILADRCVTASEGAGATVLVVGGPGVGKTALLEAAFGSEMPGVRLLRVRAGAMGTSGPFGVVRALLGSAVACLPDGPGSLVGQAALARPVFDTGVAAEPLPGPERRLGLCLGLVALVADLAQTGPLILVVDDLHDADAASGEFFALLAGHVSELPVLLVFASRPRGLIRSPCLEIAALSSCDVAELAPLGVEDTSTFLGVHAGVDSPEVAHTAWELTGGNPLFLHQVLSDGMSLRGAAEPGLSGFTRSIKRRLRALSADGLSLAVSVAVLGDEVPLSHAASVAAIETDRAAVAVDELVELALLRPGVPLAVRHALIGDVILASQSAASVAAARLRAAHLLAGVDVEAAAGQVLAVPGESRTAWAVELLRAAAARAVRRAAPDVAVAFLRAAVSGDLADLDEPDLVALAEAEAAAGADASALSARQAIMAAESATAAAERALSLGLALVNSVRPDLAHSVFDLGIRMGTRSGDETAGEVVRMLYAGRALTGDMRPESAGLGDLATLERRSRDLAAGGGERMLLAHAALARAVGGETAEEAIRFAEAAALGPARVGDPFEVGAVTIAAVSLLVCGAHDTAVLALDDLVQTAEDYGGWRTRATALHVRAHAHLRWGKLAAARDDAALALGTVGDGWMAALPSVHAALALAEVELGNTAAAEAALDVPGGEDRWGKDLTWADLLEARAAVALAKGRFGDALAESVAAGDHLGAMGADHDGVVPWRRIAVDAALSMGDIRAAGEIAEQALETSGRFGSAYLRAEALRLTGLVRGGDAGIDVLQQAAETLADLPATLSRARALIDLGELRVRHGRHIAAREPLRLAAALAHDSGAGPLESRARTLLVECGARPRRSALTGPTSLTAREEQIARLAATGVATRAIADQLFVSPKTVETHLSRVFAKLAVANRAALAEALEPND